MTDKQRLAVMVAMANSIVNFSNQLSDEEEQIIGDFQSYMPVILKEVTGVKMPNNEEDAECFEDDMERAAIEYLFAEMDYFKEKYVE